MNHDIGLQFNESMSGFVCPGETDAKNCVKRNTTTENRDNHPIQFDVQISIDAMDEFVRLSHQQATLTGSINSPLFGGKNQPIENGIFNVFTVNSETNIRQLTYSFGFSDENGQDYFFYGEKEIKDDPGFDLLDDMTTLFATIYRGNDTTGECWGAGILHFPLKTLPQMISSVKVIGNATFAEKITVLATFTSFVYGKIRDEYLQKLRPVYDTSYQNLVLSGTLTGDLGERPFFMVSGVHEKGFPWGDGATFWDVLLTILNPDGSVERFAITDHTLPLVLDVHEGTYRYEGPIFALGDCDKVSFSQLRQSPPSVPCVNAKIDIDFSATACATVPFPFPEIGSHFRQLETRFQKELRQIFNSETEFGMNITPHQVTVTSGSIGIFGEVETNWTIQPETTLGEAESSKFRNLIEPTLLYGYICAILPEQKTSRVQIHTRTMRDEKEHWGKDHLDAFLGTVYSRIASGEMRIQNGELSVSTFKREKTDGVNSPLFEKQGTPILEVNNDNYPTAVFQRRIIKVKDPSGQTCMALEESMSRMRLEAMRSTGTTKVAAIRELNKYSALEKALSEVDFLTVVQKKWQQSGKTKDDFSVVIKPNFMFAYNVADHSTYTDPKLVGRLVTILRNDGFTNIAVVEAQSTYGEYFTNRGVNDVATYLGFDGSEGYRIVDMTEDAEESEQLGQHLGNHPVSKTWKAADFRISFAKNKTHAYAYYTLCLKNIYGALPLANKFKEYHCERGIYKTAIDYMKAYPVHFGVIDAFLSADGPFGIFADADPNQTQTIIAGENLVAVDWVGATKMGIDPLLSNYMSNAVAQFGKPAIQLVGDSSFYTPWLNVPVALTQLTSKGLDANYVFGNLIYKICSEMDSKQFTHRSNSVFIKLLRKLTNPIRRAVFVRNDTPPSTAQVLLYKILYKLGY